MKILKCEGYMMFEGKMIITPKNEIPAYTQEGTWLYKPEYDCWYCKGHSYPAEICVIVNEDKEGIIE